MKAEQVPIVKQDLKSPQFDCYRVRDLSLKIVLCLKWISASVCAFLEITIVMLQNYHVDWSQKYLFRFVCWPVVEAMGRGWEEVDFGILPGGPPMIARPILRVSGSIYRCVYLGSGGESM